MSHLCPQLSLLGVLSLSLPLQLLKCCAVGHQESETVHGIHRKVSVLKQRRVHMLWSDGGRYL